MKNKKSIGLKKIIMDVNSHLQTVLNLPGIVHKKNTGICVALTRISYQLLTEAGYNLRIAGGKAAFSVNSGRWGLVDFGYSPTMNIPGTDAIGHFWLVDDEQQWIIDFTLLFLKDLVHQSDIERGLPKQIIKLPKKTIIPMDQVSSLEELMDGKIGWHYSEIKNRGNDLFSEPIPRLDIYEQ